MFLQRQSPIKLAALLLLFAGAPAVADEQPDRGFDFFGDFRLRLEQDWDYLQGDGAKHDDRQEALTTHSSYVQDDWVRWGTSVQARATNMKGSEFRALYTVRPGFNIFARLFIVDAIDLLQAGDIALETGSRFRIEANIAF